MNTLELLCRSCGVIDAIYIPEEDKWKCPICERIIEADDGEDGYYFSPDDVADWFIAKQNDKDPI